MAINGSGGNSFPAALISVIEQKNFLQTLIRGGLKPTLVFRPRKVNADDYFQGRVGESKTMTRRALLAPSSTPLNPAANTGLDNGMTGQARSYEQWTATLNEYANFCPTNILGQEAMLADLFIDNQEAIGQQAGSSLELVCSQRLFNAYDSGDTFLTSAPTGTATVNVDNVNGFITQYLASNSPLYAPPTAVTSGNKMPVAIISGTTGLITALVNVESYTIDATNVSYMQSGGFGFGSSGTLTFDANVTASKNDRLVALDVGAASAGQPPTVGQPLNPVWKDGSTVIRPLNGSNAMITTAAAMAAGNIMNPSVMIPAAVAIAKRRGIPKLSNGLYGCAIDSTILASFYGDTGFQRATATNWDRGRYFADGVIAAGWGVEFTEATQVPAYAAPGSGGFQLRHAFVFGEDVIAEHPFIAARDAADTVAGVGDVADERWVDRIKFRNLAALDTLGQVIKTAYDYVGDFQCATDKSSNPTIILSSDYARYKRGVVVQAAAPY